MAAERLAQLPLAPSGHPVSIGSCEIVGQLGAGGMARVFVAVQRSALGSEKLVVVKQVRPELVSDEHFLAMFVDEGRIALRLQHPNVVHSYEVIAEQPNYCITMEYLEGRTLLQLLQKTGRKDFPLDLHVWILKQVLAGLHYAHELRDLDGTPLQIVHRDVSPSNVFLSSNGDVKLLDFGIAKAAGAVSLTQQGVIKGKLGYAAPEQCLVRPTDARADLFAVGVMLWEAIAGCRRMSMENGVAALQARVTDREPPIEALVPDVHPVLREACRLALANAPNERFVTAHDFEQTLETYLESRSRSPSARDLGVVVRSLFESELTEQRTRIEAHVQEGRRNSSLRRAADGARVTGNADSIPSLTGSLPRPKSVLQQSWVAPAAVAFALVGLAAWSIREKPDAKAAAVSAPRASTLAPLPQVPSPSEKLPAAPAEASSDPARRGIRLTVVVAPSTARMKLDGKRVENPLKRVVPRDDSEHVLEISAPGYAFVERRLRFSEDLEVTVALTPERVAKAVARPRAATIINAPSASTVAEVAVTTARPPSTAPSPANQPQPGQDLRGPTKTTRSIDEKAPY